MHKAVRYYSISIDPLHIGTGDTRLGRVDSSIIREPGTRLPKIPATAICGPSRAYTVMKTNRYSWKEKGKDYACAGKGGEGSIKHCGMINPACPVCVPYGFSKGTGNSMQGLAQFFDAHILLFPVASMLGPIWVTSPLALDIVGIEYKDRADLQDGFLPVDGNLKNKEELNFGWLMLKKAATNISDILFPSVIPDIIKDNVVIVSDMLFSKIVNSNLEVRTSVSIDPATGTAEEGALFTYEAIPRSTILQFEIVYNTGKYLSVGGEYCKAEHEKDVDSAWVQKQVEKGLKLFDVLGIGGMNTRGMGRVRVLNLNRRNTNES